MYDAAWVKDLYLKNQGRIGEFEEAVEVGRDAWFPSVGWNSNSSETMATLPADLELLPNPNPSAYPLLWASSPNANVSLNLPVAASWPGLTTEAWYTLMSEVLDAAGAALGQPVVVDLAEAATRRRRRKGDALPDAGSPATHNKCR